MTLGKHKIVRLISENAVMAIKESERIYDILVETIRKNLVDGNNIMITGFGKFYLSEGSEKVVRNPSTGEKMILPAKRSVKFKYSGNLKKKLNG